MVAVKAPAKPATFQPINVESIVPGPGAARDIAKRSANSRCVVQPWTVIVWCSISARSEAPPPIDSSDSGAKTRASASNVRGSSGIGAAPGNERQSDADRCQKKNDGHHRPAQHADAEHGRKGDCERPGARDSELHELQPSSEGEPNGGSCNAIEDGVNRRALIDPCVTHG